MEKVKVIWYKAPNWLGSELEESDWDLDENGEMLTDELAAQWLRSEGYEGLTRCGVLELYLAVKEVGDESI
tara:strand:+ start:214 stop:426 length:213 start_codon:yes stop_codon:yes gene_type:complete